MGYKFRERRSQTTFNWKRVPPVCRQKRKGRHTIPSENWGGGGEGKTYVILAKRDRRRAARGKAGCKMGLIKELICDLRQR